MRPSLVGGDFYLGLAARILIFALAATSLNLILGFGGLVSFGHAAFVGVGAYAAVVVGQALAPHRFTAFIGLGGAVTEEVDVVRLRGRDAPGRRGWWRDRCRIRGSSGPGSGATSLHGVHRARGGGDRRS
nr:hypothetical protein [Mycobacterium tuberculosis]